MEVAQTENHQGDEPGNRQHEVTSPTSVGVRLIRCFQSSTVDSIASKWCGILQSPVQLVSLPGLEPHHNQTGDSRHFQGRPSNSGRSMAGGN